MTHTHCGCWPDCCCWCEVGLTRAERGWQGGELPRYDDGRVFVDTPEQAIADLDRETQAGRRVFLVFNGRVLTWASVNAPQA